MTIKLLLKCKASQSLAEQSSCMTTGVGIECGLLAESFKGQALGTRCRGFACPDVICTAVGAML